MSYKPVVFVLDLNSFYQDEAKQPEDVEFNLIRESLLSAGFPAPPLRLSAYVTDFTKISSSIEHIIVSLTIGIPSSVKQTNIKKISDHKWSLTLL